MRIVKNYDPHYVRLKSFGDQGVVQAVVSVFNVVDLQGDRVMPGAFRESLKRWKASGDKIPVIFSHLWTDPLMHVGYVLDAQETAEGLEVTYKIDLDTERGAHIFRLMRERRLVEHSFAYDTISERIAEDGANELLVLDLLEVGMTLKGANPETRLIAVKGDASTTTTAGSNSTVAWTATPATLGDRVVAAARAQGICDARRLAQLRSLADLHEPTLNRNAWLLKEQVADLVDSWRSPAAKEIANLNARLDAIASGERARDPDAASAVDELIMDVRQELVQEALDRAEQAEWEMRMPMNMVVDPAPVRVDSRMRPNR